VIVGRLRKGPVPDAIPETPLIKKKSDIQRITRFQTDCAEDYLKTIALLGEPGKPVRVQDIGRSLNIKPSGVSEALNKLVNAGLVRHPKHNRVELTTEGTLIAEDICLRYELLYRLLVEILAISQMDNEKTITIHDQDDDCLHFDFSCS
jgi:hypothetical protein